MLRDITIGQHFPGNSVVHRLDPRLKLLLTMAYIIILFVASNPLGLVINILVLGVLSLLVGPCASWSPWTSWPWPRW